MVDSNEPRPRQIIKRPNARQDARIIHRTPAAESQGVYEAPFTDSLSPDLATMSMERKIELEERGTEIGKNTELGISDIANAALQLPEQERGFLIGGYVEEHLAGMLPTTEGITVAMVRQKAEARRKLNMQIENEMRLKKYEK